MYTYEFEHIQIEMDGWAPVRGKAYSTDDYKEIILRRAKNGWRYVGYLPAVQRGDGLLEQLELIFEKEVP